MFSHVFVRDAYLAGTPLALACGVIGWFVVLRAQVFSVDALGHVTFVGAIAALAVGLGARTGLFALTLIVAAGLGVANREAGADEATTGVVFAWILGLGLLCLDLLASSANGSDGTAAATTLFGGLFSLGAGGTWTVAAISAAAALGTLTALRPLLLASLDPVLAAARGLRVRLLGAAFLVAVGAVTAAGAQAVGTLLVLGLVAGPAGAAHRLCTRPLWGITVSAVLAVGAVWGGIALAYAIPSLPPGSAVVGLAALAGGAGAAAAAVRDDARGAGRLRRSPQAGGPARRARRTR